MPAILSTTSSPHQLLTWDACPGTALVPASGKMLSLVPSSRDQHLRQGATMRWTFTACPHKDRSALAMVYLKTQGYDAKYLEDGLLGMAELLRGDQAKAFTP